MKITRNDLHGTAVLEFSLDDDADFKAWMKEAKKPGAGLYESAERVLKRRGGRVRVRNSPCDCEDEP